MPLLRTAVFETADAPASVTTPYLLAPGHAARGTLSSGSDQDWYEVRLTAGQQYTFALIGTGTLPIFDAKLMLRSVDGAVLAFDDNGGPDLGSTLSFKATSTGSYFVSAASSPGGGQYGLSVTTGARADYDVAMGAGAIDGGTTWGTRGSTATVTYGFRDSAAGYTVGGHAISTFSRLTPQEIAAVEQSLQVWSESSGIKFERVAPDGYTNGATMLFANYRDAADGSGAFAFLPGSTSATAPHGDVWLNLAGGVSTSAAGPGTYTYFTIMHEIGHALGLSHPGDYNAAPGVAITYANSAQFSQDSQQFTVMSYFGGSNTGQTPGGSGSAYTPMMLDIYAMQQLYGVNTATRAGDTVYGFGGNAGTLFEFPAPGTAGTVPRYCIWDGGGIDTINASGYNQAQVIDLGDGTFSNIGGGRANISIALGAVIENAVGGSGNDVIYGNEYGNVLNGNAGDDKFTPGLGHDVIDGGAGKDTVYLSGVRGDGYDVFSYGGSVYTLDRAAHEYDRSVNVEDFVGASGDRLGVAEIRRFDPLAYAASYDDLASAFHANGEAALGHYLNAGFYERRGTSFDAAQYLANHGDLRAAFGTDTKAATAHYLNFGAAEHRLADDPLAYIASYGDLIVAFGRADEASIADAGLRHYADWGYAEGRRGGIDFDADSYLARYGDLRAAFRDASADGYDEHAATLHFIRFGYAEGRTDAVA